MTRKLFEYLLKETKDRFVDKAFKAVLGDNWKEEYGDDVNGYDVNALKKFVNSSAVDKYKINWQQPADTLYNAILDAYDSYIENGGSLSQQAKAAKEDPHLLFERATFKGEPLAVVHEGEDTSNADLVILDSLENDTFMFVSPLTWTANRWLDDFSCGGQGAQWCLGWKDGPDYWNEHRNDYGDLFVMAFNKKEFANPSGEPNKLKYMVELAPADAVEDNLQIWRQTDHEDETIRGTEARKLLGHTFNELASAVVQAVGSDPNDYTESDNWAQNWGDKYDEVMDVGGDLSYYDSSVDDGSAFKIDDFIGKTTQDLFNATSGFNEVTINCSLDFKIEANNIVQVVSNKDFHISSFLAAISSSKVILNDIYSSRVYLDNSIGNKTYIEFNGCHIPNLIITKDFIEKYKDTLAIKDGDYQSINKIYLEDISKDEAIKYMSTKLFREGQLNLSIDEIILWDSKENKEVYWLSQNDRAGLS